MQWLTQARVLISFAQWLRVVAINILTSVEGSDHLPVETITSFPLVVAIGADHDRPRRALASRAGPRAPQAKARRYEKDYRVLVAREGLASVAASTSRPLVPATVMESLACWKA